MPSSTAISPLTRQIADAIGECCGARNLQPVDLTHGDFMTWLREDRDLSKEELKKVRLHLQRTGGFDNIRNTFYVGSPSEALVEREEMKGIAKLTKANTLALAHDKLFLSRLADIMTKVSQELAKHKVPTIGGATKGTRAKTARIVTLMLSDLHFGSKLDPRELPFRYDFEEEARALASVIVRLCEFKVDYREESELIIWIGGDLVRGKIHDKQGGYPAAEQFADAQWLLLQAIRIAAKHWKKVSVYCSTGNHDRDESRNPRGAHEQIWDSRATMVYVGLKNALACCTPNVEVHIPRTAYCEWEVFGHPVYKTHGDNSLQVGNPAKTVSIGHIDGQMKTINLARVHRGLKPYKVFGVGHVHQGMHLPLPTGDLVINPALIPVDGYAESVGYALTRPGQTLYESTERHPVGDLRFLDVPPSILKDKALDKVILPFKDF
jgi:hypothetical protein